MGKPGFMIVIALILLAITWVAYSYFSVRGVEHPQYTVLKKHHGYEIRQYEPFLSAQILVTGTQKESLRRGFKILFDYISGNNVKQEPIQMTAPVTQQPESLSERTGMTDPVAQEQKAGAYLISFMMPSHYTPDTLPLPQDPSIAIVSRERKKVAALRFAGYATEEKITKKQARLKDLLRKDDYRTGTPPTLAIYDPPWMPPFMRRNEVMYPVH